MTLRRGGRISVSISPLRQQAVQRGNAAVQVIKRSQNRNRSPALFRRQRCGCQQAGDVRLRRRDVSQRHLPQALAPAGQRYRF